MMVRTRRSVVLVVTAFAIGLGGLLAGCGSSSPSKQSAHSGVLTVWLGGDLTQATPGTPTRQWLDLQVKSFEEQNPGWKVQFSFLSFDNDQTAAKLTGAFSSGNVPDLINHWSGSFNTQYAPKLLTLNKYIDATPGYYSSISPPLWDVECVPNLNCNGGHSAIVGVPWNTGSTYVMFYNKKLLARAGISAPPTTYSQLFADCSALTAKGIIPVSLGATDGYTTSNMWTTNLVSWLTPGDIQQLVAGKLSYDSPQLISALEPILKLTAPSTHCTSPDALGQSQLTGINQFLAGKAAMAPLYPLEYTAFQKALGANNVGVARQPLSGTGPLLHVNNGYAAVPADAWIIPKGAANPEMAWRFIKIATSPEAQRQMVSLIGLPPALTSVVDALTQPGEKLLGELGAHPAIPELDQVMPNIWALALYRQLSLGQEQKQSAAQTLRALQGYVSANPVAAG